MTINQKTIVVYGFLLISFQAIVGCLPVSEIMYVALAASSFVLPIPVCISLRNGLIRRGIRDLGFNRNLIVDAYSNLVNTVLKLNDSISSHNMMAISIGHLNEHYRRIPMGILMAMGTLAKMEVMGKKSLTNLEAGSMDRKSDLFLVIRSICK